MNPDGSGITYLTENAVRDGDPSWAPNGRNLAFESHRDDGSEAYRMEADGSDVTRLTFNGPPEDRGTSWSPDGEQIALHSTRGPGPGSHGGNFEVYRMDADGSDQVNLTNHPAFDAQPAWSPDGSKIAFTSGRDGDFEVYSMDADDGSDVRRLTAMPGFDGRCDWGHATPTSKRDCKKGATGTSIARASSGSETRASACASWRPARRRARSPVGRQGAVQRGETLVPPWSDAPPLSAVGALAEALQSFHAADVGTCLARRSGAGHACGLASLRGAMTISELARAAQSHAALRHLISPSRRP